ncbi:trypsin-like peptidase [Tumebacillus sp. BK434]|uniref:S1C family serine protease n=1 Tax=Tumebacillus sp. BK434 TaxID=2512169 RepID=UPI00105248F3|nr:trypsin-like peptidase domain-containing protein [Tumebacillus sp. BK434]TCP58159.1 trypsin-like peptidase [Tumebacillus sp. BK434]
MNQTGAFFSRNWWLILLTVFILMIGGVGSWYVHFFYSNQTIVAASQLGNIEQTASTQQVQDKDLKSVIFENQKLVVLLQVKSEYGDSLGSGFLYNDQGDIITNAHVVEGATEVTVKMADSTIYKGSVIGISQDIDVALVRVPDLVGKAPMVLAREGKSEIGDEVIAFGSPLGLENTVTTGIISGIDRDFDLEPYRYKGVYQISAPIAPGNSGGPLVDKKTGAVIGINSAGTNQGNIGFSIPITEVLPIVENWTKHPTTAVAVATHSDSAALVSDLIRDDGTFRATAQYLVGYFYDSLNSQDFVGAYALLGSEWQGQMAYETFRNGYLYTSWVKVNDMTSSMSGDDQVRVTAIIQAEERTEKNETKFSQYQVIYQIGFENNKLKILKGSAEKI